MKTKDCSYELNILVGGRAITEYQHNGVVFVEGRKGSDFEVEFKNQTRKRVLVVPAVDGKSVFDGKTATPTSKGYIVPAWGFIRIPGWTLDGNSVARFTFEDKDRSYARMTTEVGQQVQAGVIGVLVFDEIETPPTPVYQTSIGTPFNGSPLTIKMRGQTGGLESKGMASDATPTFSVMTSNNVLSTASSTATSSEPFNMGTGFGSKADFKTNETTFNKGSLLSQLTIYYDSRRNLEKRGIQVVSREVRYLSDLPTPFAGLGCTPPPGWNG